MPANVGEKRDRWGSRGHGEGTDCAVPAGWAPETYRLGLAASGHASLVASWSVPSKDVAALVAEAQAAFGHLTASDVDVDRSDANLDVAFPAAGLAGTIAVDVLDFDATHPKTRVTLTLAR